MLRLVLSFTKWRCQQELIIWTFYGTVNAVIVERYRSMVDKRVSDIERTLRQKVNISLSMNDLRLMVNCFRAIEYWSDTDGESYLDSEGLELKRRLERLYLEELKGSPRWSFEAQMPAFLDSDR